MWFWTQPSPQDGVSKEADVVAISDEATRSPIDDVSKIEDQPASALTTWFWKKSNLPDVSSGPLQQVDVGVGSDEKSNLCDAKDVAIEVQTVVAVQEKDITDCDNIGSHSKEDSTIGTQPVSALFVYAQGGRCGAYDLVQGWLVRGQPVWEQKGGRSWISSGHDGCWLISSEKEPCDELKASPRRSFEFGFLSSSVPHSGKPPQLVNAPWRWHDEHAWHDDATIVVTTQAPPRPPSLLIVSMEGSSAGSYDLVVRMANGQPLWKQRNGKKWLYSGPDGCWFIGDDEAEKEHFDCCLGCAHHPKEHAARTPDQMLGAWQWTDGAHWHDDAAISVTSCAISPAEAPCLNSGSVQFNRRLDSDSACTKGPPAERDKIIDPGKSIAYEITAVNDDGEDWHDDDSTSAEFGAMSAPDQPSDPGQVQFGGEFEANDSGVAQDVPAERKLKPDEIGVFNDDGEVGHEDDFSSVAIGARSALRQPWLDVGSARFCQDLGAFVPVAGEVVVAEQNDVGAVTRSCEIPQMPDRPASSGMSTASPRGDVLTERKNVCESTKTGASEIIAVNNGEGDRDDDSASSAAMGSPSTLHEPWMDVGSARFTQDLGPLMSIAGEVASAEQSDVDRVMKSCDIPQMFNPPASSDMSTASPRGPAHVLPWAKRSGQTSHTVPPQVGVTDSGVVDWRGVAAAQESAAPAAQTKADAEVVDAAKAAEEAAREFAELRALMVAEAAAEAPHRPSSLASGARPAQAAAREVHFGSPNARVEVLRTSAETMPHWRTAADAFAHSHQLSEGAQRELVRMLAAAAVRKKVVVRTPASTASLGPGLGCVGLALDIWNEVTVERASTFSFDIDGAGAESLSRGTDNLVVRGLEAAFKAIGKDVPTLRYSLRSRIPVAKGLGSSAAAIVSGVLAGLALAGYDLRDRGEERLLQIASAIETQPDSLAACINGGLQIVIHEGSRWHTDRVKLPHGIICVVCCPDHARAASAARCAPMEVALEDALFNSCRAALLVAAFATSNHMEWLREATQDALRQQEVRATHSHAAPVIRAALEAGAHGAFLSGSGPVVLAFTSGRAGDLVAQSAGERQERQVAEAMLAASDAAGAPGHVLVTQPVGYGGYAVEDGGYVPSRIRYVQD